jgi:hypothetical protein
MAPSVASGPRASGRHVSSVEAYLATSPCFFSAQALGLNYSLSSDAQAVVEDAHSLRESTAWGHLIMPAVAHRNLAEGCSDHEDPSAPVEERIWGCTLGHRTVEVPHKRSSTFETDETHLHGLQMYNPAAYAHVGMWNTVPFDDGMSVKAGCCTRQLEEVIDLVQNCPSEKSVWHVFVEVCGGQDRLAFLRVLLLVLATARVPSLELGLKLGATQMELHQ